MDLSQNSQFIIILMISAFMILQHMGSKEDVAARIEADTRVKIEEMNQTVAIHKNPVRHFRINL